MLIEEIMPFRNPRLDAVKKKMAGFIRAELGDEFEEEANMIEGVSTLDQLRTTVSELEMEMDFFPYIFTKDGADWVWLPGGRSLPAFKTSIPAFVLSKDERDFLIGK